MMQKVGLLGGTFDPVHNGHLQLGDRVLENYNLDKILFIPASTPPHKNEAVSAVGHRLQMLKLAISGNRRFDFSEIEISRQKVSYTFDNIQELKSFGGKEVLYHFIIGYDALSEIETWYRWQDLLVVTNFIVAVRPGFSLKEIEQLLERNGFSPEDGGSDRWIGEQTGNEILFLAGEIADISSTEIRSRIASRKPWTDLVPPLVADYIISNRLYDK
jgi:nicotinate-nucleotide adenylyltransferase